MGQGEKKINKDNPASSKKVKKESQNSSETNHQVSDKTKVSTASKSKKTKKSVQNLSFRSTAEIPVSKNIVQQVIGQDKAVEVIKKAAEQRRHVLLIGEPGTGKSMLGLALAELLPKEKLTDLLSFYNPNDDNQPLIRTVKAGQGRSLVAQAKLESMKLFKNQNIILFVLLILAMIAPWWALNYYSKQDPILGGIMFLAFFLGSIGFLAAFMLLLNLGRKALGFMGQKLTPPPKLIVDNFNKKQAPFFDATGAHAGALLGDVLHDPFQSGGLGTPPHERVVAGMIHKAHLGVLFIDEIATLHPQTQQELLTALQEGKFAITGQSERSAGAMVRTEPVPCKFVLVAAGNVETLKNLHPALRSRIRGYGYEAFMEETMRDTYQNRFKIAQFVAQEVVKDERIPHFSQAAVKEMIKEARKMANRKAHLTLRLRDLGGLVRAAGDLAVEKKAKLVQPKHIRQAKTLARSLEKQIADKYIERKKEYEVIKTSGGIIGRVNGLAVIGGGTETHSGIILPIEAEVTPGGKQKQITATGKLGDIAKEAVVNVSALIKKFFGEDIKNKYDIYVQFLQTYEGVEGDSASVAVATAIISALKKIPVRQDTAMTGSLSVRGDVLPIGGVSAKVLAAAEAGIKRVLVPKSNLQDLIPEEKNKQMEIIPVDTIIDVLEKALDWEDKEKILNTIKSINGIR